MRLEKALTTSDRVLGRLRRAMEKAAVNLEQQEECVRAKESVVCGVRDDLAATRGTIETFWALPQNRKLRTAYRESTIALKKLEPDEWRRMGRLDTEMPHCVQSAAHLLCDMFERDMQWKHVQYLTSSAKKNKEHHKSYTARVLYELEEGTFDPDLLLVDVVSADAAQRAQRIVACYREPSFTEL